MNNRQNVPGIARGPQSFSPRSLPPISNPMGQPPAMQADGVSVEDELAMEIYARLASAIISAHMDSPHPTTMWRLAQHARVAAKAFFEEQPSNAQA